MSKKQQTTGDSTSGERKHVKKIDCKHVKVVENKSQNTKGNRSTTLRCVCRSRPRLELGQFVHKLRPQLPLAGVVIVRRFHVFSRRRPTTHNKVIIQPKTIGNREEYDRRNNIQETHTTQQSSVKNRSVLLYSAQSCNSLSQFSIKRSISPICRKRKYETGIDREMTTGRVIWTTETT